MLRPTPDPVRPGQESVWSYPRPPRLEPTPRHLRVELAGQVLAETGRGVRVLETSHPPVYYFPPDAVAAEWLRPRGGSTACEWKGSAAYFDAVVGEVVRENAAWRYPVAAHPFGVIAGWYAFYAGRVDACYVDGERVVPQPGDFYGGWITPDVVGPFKGGPGTWGW